MDTVPGTQPAASPREVREGFPEEVRFEMNLKEHVSLHQADGWGGRAVQQSFLPPSSFSASDFASSAKGMFTKKPQCLLNCFQEKWMGGSVGLF